MATEKDIKNVITFLKKEYPKGILMYNTRNIVGDILYTIYDKNGITIDECYEYDYIEIFGLSENEFNFVRKDVNKYKRYKN